MSKLENLKITAFLQTPVVTDAAGFLPLDGILYYHHCRNMLGEPQIITRSNQSVVPKGFDRENPLPFKKIGVKQDWTDENLWYYACSFAQWRTETANGADHWNKRFDIAESYLVDFRTRKEKVNNQQGQFKSYHVPIFYRHAASVEWFAVADRERVWELLKFCTSLGKKCSQGWGAVLKWRVDSWRWDWSSYDCKGRLMRSIPQQDGVLFGLRPSYWNPRHQFLCALPE